MSAYKWLVMILALPVFAFLIMLGNQINDQAIPMMYEHSSTAASHQGIEWYATFWQWIPFVVLLLVVFAIVVGILVRRRRTVR